MTKTKMYRYLGRNGLLTTRILLDGIPHILMYELRPAEGRLLSNGEKTAYSVLVEEAEVSEWHEITDKSVE